MINIENVEVYGWEAAIRGMRNPMNSWEKSDSNFNPSFLLRQQIGENDLALMKKLAAAGTDHSKFMRMITVTCDIIAPMYWVAEHDTYKVGTVRNSCSFMHKGLSKPFEIKDFSVQDERVYYLLSPIEKEKSVLTYPYETSKYKIYELRNGRKYKVYKNGKVFACEFECVDTTGRKRKFDAKEIIPSLTKNGYFEMNLGGRSGEKWLLHRLIATVWCENKNNFETIDHIDGNKGNNCAENLQWCKREENIQRAYKNGVYDKNQMHRAYYAWKMGHKLVEPHTKQQIKREHENGMLRRDISQKHNLDLKQVDNILYQKSCKDEDLFLLAYHWEQLIDILNTLRNEYLEIKDDTVFKMIRQLLPQGYNIKYTWQSNYQVLRNMYHSRKNHKLSEWRAFCEWIKSLPYSELITGEEV